MKRDRWFALAATTLAVSLWFCGGNPSSSPGDPAFNCTPSEPASNDYRHDAKHVDLIGGTPQEVTVTDVLSWPFSDTPAPTAPRSGRELQLFHIAKAYLQSVYLVAGDCDLHF